MVLLYGTPSTFNPILCKLKFVIFHLKWRPVLLLTKLGTVNKKLCILTIYILYLSSSELLNSMVNEYFTNEHHQLGCCDFAALVFTYYCLKKGRVTLFRLKIIITNCLYLMASIHKISINRFYTEEKFFHFYLELIVTLEKIVPCPTYKF